MPSVLSKNRMKVHIKSIGFCRISIIRTGVMEDCRGDQVRLSNALYVTIYFRVVVSKSLDQPSFIVRFGITEFIVRFGITEFTNRL